MKKGDLISRETLLEWLCEGCNGATQKGCGNPCCDYELIELAPAVDAVPVVRCKDCKHYDHGVCTEIEYIMDGYYRGTFEEKCPDDFCSYGVRKDGEIDG